MKKVLTLSIAALFIFSLGLFAFAEEEFAPVEDSSSTASIEDFASMFETFSTDEGGFDLAGLLGDSSGGGIMDMLGGLTGESGGDISAVMDQVLGGVEGNALLDTLTQSFGSLGLGVEELLGGGFSGDSMDDMYAGLLGGLDSMGIDTGMLTSMLGESSVFNMFAGLYTAGKSPDPPTTTEAPTEAPTTPPTSPPSGKDNPNTGSPATGVTVFAVLTVAAAVAFVARKKKED